MPSKQPIESQMIQWFRMAVKNDPGSARLMYTLIRGEMAGLLKRGPKIRGALAELGKSAGQSAK